jgi:hypothetical protein
MTQMLFRQRLEIIKIAARGMGGTLLWLAIATALAYLYVPESFRPFVFDSARAIAAFSIAYFFVIAFIAFFLTSAVSGQTVFAISKGLWLLPPWFMSFLIAKNDKSDIAVFVWALSLLVTIVSGYYYCKACLEILARARTYNIRKGFFNPSNGYVDFIAIPMRKSPEYEKTKEEKILWWSRLLAPFLPALGMGLNRILGYDIKFFVAIFMCILLASAIVGDVIWEVAFLKEILLLEKSENRKFVIREN